MASNVYVSLLEATSVTFGSQHSFSFRVCKARGAHVGSKLIFFGRTPTLSVENAGKEANFWSGRADKGGLVGEQGNRGRGKREKGR